MMDIKDIIKWFIPCFHILLKWNMSNKLLLLVLVFYLNFTASAANSEIVLSSDSTKDVVNDSLVELVNGKGSQRVVDNSYQVQKTRTHGAVGRTFGRPFKKMIAGLLPVIFQVGAASTWAVVAALVGVKTLMVALVILKLLLLAGAAKLGALFASKGHQHPQWEPPHAPQKEIHLHIHNGHPQVEHAHVEHSHEEHIPFSPWSRDSTQEAKVGYIYEPYRGGPQTISTPYGNYVKIDPGAAVTS